MTSLSLGLANRTQAAQWWPQGAGYAADFVAGRYMSSGAAVSSAVAIGFTRAIPKWTVDTTGRLRQFAVDVPALIGSGILLEPAATNLLPRSSELDHAAWTKSQAVVSANAIQAPDGTLSADLLREDSSPAATHHARQTFAATNNTTYTVSVFARFHARRVALRLRAHLTTGHEAAAAFDLEAGTFTTSSTTWVPSAAITPLVDGWFRLQLSAKVLETATVAADFMLATASNATLYNGDGSSGCYFWGMQLEVGSSASSLIPTATSAVTRAADALSLQLPAGTFDLSMIVGGTLQTVDDATGNYALTPPMRLERITALPAS